MVGPYLRRVNKYSSASHTPTGWLPIPCKPAAGSRRERMQNPWVEAYRPAPRSRSPASEMVVGVCGVRSERVRRRASTRPPTQLARARLSRHLPLTCAVVRARCGEAF